MRNANALNEDSRSLCSSGSDTMYPLCVDLDGTLIHTDVLHENLVAVFVTKPWVVFCLFFWLIRGRAYFKARLAEKVGFDPSLLPYDERVLDYLRREKAKGRRVILATGSARLQADAVAEHLGLFDAVLATEPDRNLKGSTKAALLSELLARFSYLGNDRSDIAVWGCAETASIANASTRLVRRISNTHKLEIEIPRRPGLSLAVAKALRPYQWTKNLLIFVPILTANQISDRSAWVAAFFAFLGFSITASGIYVLNDLTDLAADRRHLRKRYRPFASGMVPVWVGMVLAPFLLAVGLAIGWRTGALSALLLYVVVSLSYTIYAKELPLVDVFCLAFLYVIRLVAGGLATGFFVSQWLLGFSAFLFLSLAFVKRVAEISAEARKSVTVSRRGYLADDYPVLKMMGVTSSFASCVLLALFVQSPEVAARYATPVLLWALVPLILFWQLRLWLSTTRGYMHDDPIVYAARDWVSWIAAAFGAAIMLLASHMKILS